MGSNPATPTILCVLERLRGFDSHTAATNGWKRMMVSSACAQLSGWFESTAHKTFLGEW